MLVEQLHIMVAEYKPEPFVPLRALTRENVRGRLEEIIRKRARAGHSTTTVVLGSYLGFSSLYSHLGDLGDPNDNAECADGLCVWLNNEGVNASFTREDVPESRDDWTGDIDEGYSSCCIAVCWRTKHSFTCPTSKCEPESHYPV